MGMTKGDLAREYFLNGYNCAQSVACAFADRTGLPVETAARMASGFGGGVGRLREVCGCVCGMVLVYSLLHGYPAPGPREEKAAFYGEIQVLADRFRAGAGGSIVCRELLGLARPEGTPMPEERTPAYYQKRPCPALAKLAGDVLEQFLKEKEAELP